MELICVFVQDMSTDVQQKTCTGHSQLQYLLTPPTEASQVSSNSIMDECILAESRNKILNERAQKIPFAMKENQLLLEATEMKGVRKRNTKEYYHLIAFCIK